MTNKELPKLIQRIESSFDELTEFADFENNPEKMKKILEMTDKAGAALIYYATWFSSLKIIDYLLEKKIRINNCNSKFLTAQFNSAEISKKIINFVNPKIIDFKGNSQLYYNQKNFTDMSLQGKADKY